MKRFATLVLATLGVVLGAGAARADWGTLCYGGCQPKWCFWNRHCAKTACCGMSEEQRWQQFWHDYYDALQHYYDRLDNIDWVTYYKFHGYQLNGGACGPYGNPYCRPQYAPVFVSPTIQWAVPQAAPGGVPPVCPPAGHHPY
jgi:hypothetical protein